MGDVVLKCEHLHKNFGKKEILKDVSLELEKGDILGFIGPNGAGKTTTIKLILGLQSITSGTVKINGYDITSNFTNAIRNVGAIVENPDLYMYLTGYENLKLIANLYKGVGKERIDEVVKLVKLENRINDKVSRYSLGMRQRLGIAQAILHKPNLLILDEPTNGLDPEGIKEIRELLKDLAEKEEMAVLISSHNLLELETFCNKICIIKNGKVMETNKIEDVKNIAKSKPGRQKYLPGLWFAPSGRENPLSHLALLDASSPERGSFICADRKMQKAPPERKDFPRPGEDVAQRQKGESGTL